MPNLPHHTRAVVEQRHKPYFSPSHDPGTHFDRTAIIVLSVILFLILVAVAWYLYLHFTGKRQDNLERRFPTTLEEDQGRVEWYGNDSIGGRDGTRDARSNSTFKLKPFVTRKDSLATTISAPSSVGIPITRLASIEGMQWHSLSSWQTRGFNTTILGDNMAPGLSLDTYTLPLSSTERPLPTYSPWQPHKRNSDPLPMQPPSYTAPSRSRSSALFESRAGEEWRHGAARLSLKTMHRRRLSILQTVLEPDTTNTNISKSVGMPGRARESDMEHGGSHTSWKGSGGESVTYDWSRSADEEVQGRSDMFNEVVWNRNIQGSD